MCGNMGALLHNSKDTISGNPIPKTIERIHNIEMGFEDENFKEQEDLLKSRIHFKITSNFLDRYEMTEEEKQLNLTVIEGMIKRKSNYALLDFIIQIVSKYQLCQSTNNDIKGLDVTNFDHSGYTIGVIPKYTPPPRLQTVTASEIKELHH